MSEDTGDNSKPRVVVLGGCGFIGRNLVEYLISNDFVSSLRVVDKTPPQLAFLNATHTKIFEDPRVEFKSANLINPTSCANALDPDGGASWSLVVNCAGETRPGQSEAVYEEGIVTLSVNVARRCKELRVDRLIEISSGQMCNSEKPLTEDCPIEPWTVEGRMKAKVERALQDMEDLNFTIIRPAIVYGIGDRRSMTPRLLLGAVYRHLRAPMRLLWAAELARHTVHVRDVCGAAWQLARHAPAARRVFHVVDAAHSTHGSLAALVADIFHIQHDYYGAAVSTIAKAELGAVALAADDKHLTAWGELCARHGVAHSPLEPSAPPELLRPERLQLRASRLPNPAPLTHPRPTTQNLLEILEDYAEMNLFPKALLL